MLSLIAAMSENRVIGRDGQLPWHLPADLRWFKKTTIGHHIIMGRKTFQSPGHPLPGRTSIILTRDVHYQPDVSIEHDDTEIFITNSLDDALTLVKESDDDEPFIIGGGEIYQSALPHVDRMYLTRVYAEVQGDAFFPEFNEDDWEIIEERHYERDARHEYAFTIQIMQRKVCKVPPSPGW